VFFETIQARASTMIENQNAKVRPARLFQAVIGDIHLWIPLVVLLAGLLLLHHLR
jgi:hypothetical protein